MKLSVGSNISSIAAQRRLAESSDTLSGVFERLSSGQRINRAADDAAGLAIADNLNAQARLFSMARRNINDGVSLIGILDGAVEAQKSILVRMAELSEQSSNGVFSSEQRSSLMDEFQALQLELSRIAATTEYNGQNLLLGERAGELRSLALQAGIDSSLQSLIQISTLDTGQYSGTLSAQDMVLASDFITANLGNNLSLTYEQVLDQVSPFVIEVTATDDDGDERQVLLAFMRGGDEGELYALEFVQSESDPSLWESSIDVNDLSAITFDTGGTLQFDENGDFISSALQTSHASRHDGVEFGELDFSALKLDRGADRSSAVDFLSIQTQESSRVALDAIKNRLTELSTMRGELGSAQSRLELANSNLIATIENTRSAESRIRDVDVVTEGALLVTESIRQQAAAAVLAQANQAPALALQLLT